MFQQTGWIAVDAEKEAKLGRGADGLGERRIDVPFGPSGETSEGEGFDIVDDADDGAPFWFPNGPEAAADRVGAGPELFGGGTADEDDRSGSGGISGGKGAAGEERDAEGVEVLDGN